MNRKNLKKCALFCLLIGVTASLWGTDTRTIPIDVYLIVDSSVDMEKGKNEAISWLCNTVIDGILQPEDRIWIWTAGVRPELVYSGSLGNKENAKASLRTIAFKDNSADYRGALQEARTQAGKSDRITYTLLVSGSGAKDPPTREAESAGLLRYSRVENFSGWRVLTVGLDLDAKIRRASAYHTNRR